MSQNGRGSRSRHPLSKESRTKVKQRHKALYKSMQPLALPHTAHETRALVPHSLLTLQEPLCHRVPAHHSWVFRVRQARTAIRTFQTSFPSPRVERLRVSPAKLGLAPHSLFLAPPRQLSAHHHLVHGVVVFKESDMPSQTVLCAKIHIDWSGCESFRQLVSPAV